VSDSEPQYDDKQVALILKRATEMQTRTGDGAAAAGRGLSLADLENIAVEAGIDPSHIRLAAREVDAGTADRGGEWAWLLGAPVTLTVHRVVNGEVPEDFFDDLLVLIQTAGIGNGTAGQVGRTLTWHTISNAQNADSAQITIAVRDGRTELHATRNRTQSAMGWMAGGVLGGGTGLGIGLGLPLALEVLQSPLAAVLIPATVVTSCYAAARSFFKRGHVKHRANLEELLDRLADAIQREVARRLPKGDPPAS